VRAGVRVYMFGIHEKLIYWPQAYRSRYKERLVNLTVAVLWPCCLGYRRDEFALYSWGLIKGYLHGRDPLSHLTECIDQ
jgi:hypothetical protein